MFWLCERNNDREILLEKSQSESSGFESSEVEKRKITIIRYSSSQWNTWRWLSGLMGLFFFLAAYVQYNDPDPYLWMMAYLVPCFVSWTITSTSYRISFTKTMTLFHVTYFNIDVIIICHIILCFVLGIWTLIYYCLFKMRNEDFLRSSWNLSEDEMLMEEAKELLGLCLTIAWLSLMKNRNFVLLGKAGMALGITLTMFPFIAWIFVGIYEAEEAERC